MKTGDILLFKGASGMSRIIAWGTESEYSHVAVCVSPEMGLAIEAMAWKGIRGIDIRKIKGECDHYRVKEGHSYNKDDMLSYLVDKLNSRYDYWGVIFLGIIKIFAKIGRPLKNTANKWQKDRDYFCSELCYEAFRHGGLDIVPDIPAADITSPGDIAKSRVVERAERDR
jgi:hypothetical protein